jgi:hypothetical protein
VNEMEPVQQIVDSKALRSMTPTEILAAQREGRLAALLGGADIRKGAKLTAKQWAVVVENLTDQDLAAAEADRLLEPLHAAAASPRPTPDIGARGGRAAGSPHPSSRAGQLARLRQLTPAQIVAKHRRGALDPLLRGEIV